MFDFENPNKEEVLENERAEVIEDASIPAWETADWEQITEDHAEEGAGIAGSQETYGEVINRVYRNIHSRRRERTAIRAVRYAMLAIGLTAVAWLVRDYTKLAFTLGGIALMFGMISAYGAGKCREM